ncbi:hypothetical protein [Comamonas sp.]|jgi:hypothetical protein|uniref:hypothetical protein n=1 Tax=Comamonas sp. TaxID=34028 RepID=UPI00264A406B|nr:hypothetical protein [Comamonas sp.]MDN5537355.1 hypothetical protein [Comamonas sp.]
MKFIKITLFIFVLGLLGGCPGFPPKPGPVDGNKEEIGLNVYELKDEIKTYSSIPEKNKLYGQLYVNVELKEAAIKGPEERNISDYFFSVYGSEVRQVGIVVIPIVNDVRLPEVALFVYKYDSNKKEWASSITRRYGSPVMMLGDNGRIAFDFKYVTSDSLSVDIKAVIGDIVKAAGVLEPGSWIISAASKPIVGAAADSASKMISSVLSVGQVAIVSDQLEPVGDGVWRRAYMATAGGAKDLAKITFTAKMTTSIVSGQPVFIEEDSPDIGSRVPKLDANVNPLNKIRIAGGNSKTLGDVLKENSKIALVGVTNPVLFKNKCREILADLEGDYGLTVFDSLNSMRHLLRDTDFYVKESLFNSDCLVGDEKALLAEMKVPVVYTGPVASPVTSLNDDSLKKLSGYMKASPDNRGDEVDVLNMFSSSESIMVTSVPGKLKAFPSAKSYIQRQDLLKSLGDIGVAKIWWQKPTDENGSPISGMIMYFRPLDKKELFALDLNQAGGTGAVNNIVIRVVSDSELSPSLKEKLLAPADPLVHGASGDIMLSKAQ